MTMRSGFFDSDIVGYDDEGLPVFDRAEDAEFFSRFWAAIVGNGVFANPSNGFKVIADTGMRLKVMPGMCWIEGRYAFDLEHTSITLTNGDLIQNRIDRIVLRLDLQTRDITINVKQGTPSATPAAPQLTRPSQGESADIYELGLADVLVQKYATSIAQDKITDLRLSKAYCGVVTGMIEQADTTAIFEQYEKYLNDNIAEWNRRKQQQATDWRKQMNDQQSGFNTKMSEIEGWYSSIRTDIAKVQTFDFDNLCSYPGCVVDMVKDSAGNYTETVVIEGTGVRVADRVTVKSSTGSYTETIRAYERDGTTVMKRFVITTTKQANGSYRTKVSGTYIPPDTPSDGNIKAGPNMMLKVVD